MLKKLFYISQKLKSIVLLLWCSSYFFVISAQNRDYEPTIVLDHLSVQNNGRLMGFMGYGQEFRVCKADSFGGSWSSKKLFSEFNAINNISDFTIFNADTFFLSGYMSDSSHNGDSYILRTINGGESFQKVYQKGTKSNNHIDETFCNPTGEAWLSLPDVGISFSKDYGLTWQIVGKLPQSRLRANNMFFQNSQIGLISTGWGGLFFTRDNCRSFQTLPTPYDQKKAFKIYAHEGPESVTKTLIFQDWLLVYMSNHWFYSKKDKIEWQRLDNISDLFFDKESNKLWGLTDEHWVIEYDNQLKKVWQGLDKVERHPLSIQYKNDVLYIFSYDLMYKITRQMVTKSLYYQANTPITIDLEHQTKSTNITWGWDYQNIYHSKDLGKTWYRIKQIPEYFGGLNVLNDSMAIIFRYKTQECFSYNHNSGQIEPYKCNVVENFFNSKIVKFSIEEGSRGCFHGWTNIIAYTFDKKQNKFIGRYEQKGYPSENIDTNYTNSCSYSQIDSFVHALNQGQQKKLQFKDFNIQPSDKKEYWAKLDSIIRKKNQINNDYEFLSLHFDTIDKAFFKSVVNRSDLDSVLESAFLTDIGFSTTTNWVRFVAENEKGEHLELENEQYIKQPYYIGWKGRYNNWKFSSTDIGVYNFLSSLSPRPFWREATNEKWAIYFGLAKYLYEKKLEKD